MNQLVIEQIVGIALLGIMVVSLPIVFWVQAAEAIKQYEADEKKKPELSPAEMDTLSQAFVSWETSRC